ncbi:hypothetical protein P5705_13075 [Pseudomonas entomophila]|uniref:hypothetical protein n=1 Tax=Pseudomonas entomophila TaxID=312306 RepID=UPI002405CFF6|nr:hypothetical protein [Pseudomonas entomophila]MDF9618577.1 hypothetical protein [Pseudomonas entomophila]
MANPQKETQRYLESVLGVPTHLKPVSPRLPYHLLDAYTCVELTLEFKPSPLPLLLLVPTTATYPGAVTLTKHIAQISKATDASPIYVYQALSPADRRSLISHQLNFIQPGYQLFIPELAMDLRERVRQRREQAAISALPPAAQAMLLARLYRGGINDTPFPASALLGDLNYSRVTLSKVVEQLLQTGLLIASQPKGAVQAYAFSASAPELFKQVRPYLRSPVKRKVAISAEPPLGQGAFLAGETALASQTLLTAPAQPVYGMTKRSFDALLADGSLHLSQSVDDTRAWVEIWAYDTLDTSGNRADAASLLLSLDNSQDERVQMALDELRERVEWLGSGD